MGLKATTKLEDVFSVYKVGDDESFQTDSLEMLDDPNFQHDFDQLYKYYKETRFSMFQLVGPHLFHDFPGWEIGD